jgi:hypothetical protein
LPEAIGRIANSMADRQQPVSNISPLTPRPPLPAAGRGGE